MMNPDLAAYRAWRSETYTALVNRRKFKNQRSHQAKVLTQSLTSMLQILVPGASPQELSISIRKTIIEPSLNLAHKMQLSTNRIFLDWTPLQNLDYSNRRTQPFEYSLYENVNLLAHGKTLKFPDHQIAPARDDIKYIFDIFPALVYQKVKADAYAEPKVLKKAKVLVAVVEEGKEWQRSGTEGAEGTLLGWLNERRMKRHAKDEPGLIGSVIRAFVS